MKRNLVSSLTGLQMFQVISNDFKILAKFKLFVELIDRTLENVPRKDKYYKDKVRSVCMQTLELIITLSFLEYKDSNIELKLKTNISLLDFLVDRLYSLEYISEKRVYELGRSLTEILKMASGLAKSKDENKV